MPDGIEHFGHDWMAAYLRARDLKRDGCEVEIFPRFPTENEKHWSIAWLKSSNSSLLSVSR